MAEKVLYLKIVLLDKWLGAEVPQPHTCTCPLPNPNTIKLRLDREKVQLVSNHCLDRTYHSAEPP